MESTYLLMLAVFIKAIFPKILRIDRLGFDEMIFNNEFPLMDDNKKLCAIFLAVDFASFSYKYFKTNPASILKNGLSQHVCVWESVWAW